MLQQIICLFAAFSLLCPESVFSAEFETDSGNRPLALWAESDTWVATDALGRRLPTHQEVGPRKPGKYVAMFYWTWHVDGNVTGDPVNVELVTRRFPEATNDYNHSIWKRMGHGYHWDEPLLGYYRSTDRWILRKHAEMLSDAGVDVIVFDATNGSLTWKNAYEVLFPVFEEARAMGVRTPQVAFMLPFGPGPHSLVSIKQLYADIYEPGRFKDLWFFWKGKPLIMAYADNVPEPIKSFFTFRPGQPVYKTGPTRPDHWGWLEIHPQHGFAISQSGQIEQVPVGVAQNATHTLWPAAMNDVSEVFGRGFTTNKGPDHSADAVARGLNFQEQWSRAFELDPELVFITGWNEWTAGRHEAWQKTENAFPDQFNDEYSRDIEPMKGGFGDNYYYQFIANVRRFKGVKASSRPSAMTTIRIDGEFDDWSSVSPEYRDHKGDTMHRHHAGYGSRIVYTNTTGRNDFILCKVARDRENIYFYARTTRAITPPEGSHWMMLLLDIDREKSSGWQGYEFAVNRVTPQRKALLEWNDGHWKWQANGRVAQAVTENEIELALPYEYLGIQGEFLDFEFKWIDNMQQEGRVMDFYQYGDAAPSGRFNYVYRVKENSSAPGSP